MNRSELIVSCRQFIDKVNKKYKIKLSYIFGSRARGTENNLSDIDIALLFDREYSDMDDALLRGELIEMGLEFFSIPVDIVSLNKASLALSYEVVKDGALVFEASSDTRVEFEAKVLSNASMVNRDIILLRIDKLREYLSYLKQIDKYSREEYSQNPMLYGSFERFLHLAIECILDIGNHVISDLRFRKPESNKDIFEVLSENKIIDSELKESLCKMAGFRNILVHDYMKLNRAIVYDIIQNNLKDLENFASIVVQYI
jgi:uncharacterized protein YutE (UPF0331/DUF86 family)/predicted nucleotidyltransferase